MTRFERELNGSLGAYWKAEAEKELARIKAELDAGKITIDDQGVALNCIGRPLMSDMAEKVALVTDRIDREATAQHSISFSSIMTRAVLRAILPAPRTPIFISSHHRTNHFFQSIERNRFVQPFSFFCLSSPFFGHIFPEGTCTPTITGI